LGESEVDLDGRAYRFLDQTRHVTQIRTGRDQAP
jgi:hypothetical protein